MNQKRVLTPSPSLCCRLNTNNLLNSSMEINGVYGWAFSSPFLSIVNNSGVRLIQNHDDIIKYLKQLPPKRTTIDPIKDFLDLSINNIFINKIYVWPNKR